MTTNKERINVPDNISLGGGIMFAVYNLYTSYIEFIVEPKLFMYKLPDTLSSPQFKKYLNIILRHESIHREQERRNKVGSKDKSRFETTPNQRSYWSIKEEIMAYAQTIVDELRNSGYTDDEILNLAKKQCK